MSKNTRKDIRSARKAHDQAAQNNAKPAREHSGEHYIWAASAWARTTVR